MRRRRCRRISPPSGERRGGGRLYPGEGQLPLAALLAAAPDVPIGIEAPRRRRAALSFGEQAQQAHAAPRRASVAIEWIILMTVVLDGATSDSDLWRPDRPGQSTGRPDGRIPCPGDGRNTMVVQFHVTPDDFGRVVASLGPVRNVDGFIATVPRIFAACAQCATLSPRAKFLGVANVVREERRWPLAWRHAGWAWLCARACILGLRSRRTAGSSGWRRWRRQRHRARPAGQWGDGAGGFTTPIPPSAMR